MKLKNILTLVFLFVGLLNISAQVDCDCDEPDYESEGICVELEDAGVSFILWAPDECNAICLFGEEFTIVDCDNGGWGWQGECDCPEEDWTEEGICIEAIDLEYDTLSFVTWVPSECLAACWYETYTVVACDDNGWGYEEDCDCPEDDWNEEGFCIEIVNTNADTTIYESYTTWVPSDCFADCLYENYTVVDCYDGGYGEGGQCDWDLECECEIDSEEGICIAYLYSDTIFGTVDTLIEWVPNECFAACWGFEDYLVVDCEDLWDWEDDNDPIIVLEGDADCIVELLSTEDISFQAFLYGLADCGAIELNACVLAAPIFDTDEEFIDYLIESCPEWFGLVMDESEGPSLFTSYGQSQEGQSNSTSTTDIEGLELSLLGNPVVGQLNVSINTVEALDIKMVLTSATGQVLNVENIKVSKGHQVYQLNTVQLPGGIYNMTMSNAASTQTIKFVVIK